MSQISRIFSVAFQGLDAVLVEVEADVIASKELILTIVGLPSTAVKESKDRVIAALRNTKSAMKELRCTVNLAPADIKKEGSFYDLPIALGIMAAMGGVPNPEKLGHYLVAGELGLGGELRPIRGALCIAMLAKDMGMKGVILPEINGKEASVVPGIELIAVKNLQDTLNFFRNGAPGLQTRNHLDANLFKPMPPSIDFADVKGQAHVKRALEIAAAGGHNIVLFGPPGTGKTMLAKALVGIMPELTPEEALETTKIHSIAGILAADQSLVTDRPFRSPHHTVSYAGLIGGGANPRPGEVTLAHNGILFLDELPEFSRTVLEVLRQPLEDRLVTISRAKGNTTYPTNFLCIAAMNPCPCGYLGHPDKACKDSQAEINRYRGKVSGPLWDRLDMHIEVPALRYSQMMGIQEAEPSSVIRERVGRARHIQKKRYQKNRTNSLMTKNDLKRYAPLDAASNEVLRHAVDELGISARACDRIIRVARTIADLDGDDTLSREHVMEALNFRSGQ